MKSYSTLLFLVLFLGTSAMAQEANIFLGRDFWKTSPDVATVKQKIEEGNDPVAMNAYAFDAITYSILEDTPLETTKYLLSLEGNEVDKSTHDGRNYLLWAGYKGNIPLMELLIEMGSDTKLVDDHGYNLMTFAAVAGQQNTAVYDLILANGGSINDTNRSGANALLLLAPHIEDTGIVDYFLEKGLDLHATDEKGNNMFNYAARLGNKPIMEMLIAKGVDYKSLNKEGGNAFMFAAGGYRGKTNELATFEYLDKLGLEANIVTTEGLTPIHMLAYRQKDGNVFQFFLDKGLDVNQLDQDGNTAFMRSIRGRNMEAATLLLPITTSINHKNKDGFSALTYAMRSMSKESVDLLMANGADIKCVDKENRNLVTHLFDVYRDRDQEKFEALLNMVIAQEVTTDKPFSKGSNLLHLAVEKNSSYLIEKAIAMNQAVNHKNEDGLTPLHLAAMKSKDEQLLKLLIQHGADLAILTDFEESAFDLANENELLEKNEVDLNFLRID